MNSPINFADDAKMRSDNDIVIEYPTQQEWLGIPNGLGSLIPSRDSSLSEHDGNQIGELVENWLRKRHPSIFKLLCFIDLVFYDSQNPLQQAGYLIIAANKDVGDQYAEAIQRLVGYTDNSKIPVHKNIRSIGAHRDFLAGLPFPDHASRRGRAIGGFSISQEQDAVYHLLKISWKPNSIAYKQKNGLKWFHKFERLESSGTSGLIRDESSKKPFEENIKTFIKLLRERNITDEQGRAVSHLIGAPLNAPLRQSKNKVTKYQNVAQVFFGFSAEPNARPLKRFLADVCLLTYATTAGSASHETGAQNASEEAMRQFAHQIKSIGSKVDRWLVTPERWDNITAKFASDPSVSSRLVRDSYKLAPVPELHKALGRTIILWSLTYNSSDLFPETNGAPPADVASLAMSAWELAKDACFVRECAPKAFDASNDDVRSTWTHDRSRQKKIIASSMIGWRIALQKFGGADNTFKVEPKNTEYWKQISGLLRIIVVVCENFLGYAETGETLTLNLEAENGQMRLVCSNKMPPKGPPRSSRNNLGFTGLELIDYLCKDFLGLCATKTEEPTSDTYNLVITFRQPEWLIPNE